MTLGVGEGIAIGSFVLSTIGFMYKMTKDVAEIRKQVTNDIQHLDEKYVGKDICKVLHNQTAKDIAEIKIDVKALLKK
jgi:glycine/serine hydroxymethyltransferase